MGNDDVESAIEVTLRRWELSLSMNWFRRIFPNHNLYFDFWT